MKIRAHGAGRQASSEQRSAGTEKETRWFHATHLTVFIFSVKRVFSQRHAANDFKPGKLASFRITLFCKTCRRNQNRTNAPKLAPNAAGNADRMLQLITAAEDIFLAKGYHTATMSDVAKAAGMSKKTVYTMIESKAELFGALLTTGTPC